MRALSGRQVPVRIAYEAGASRSDAWGRLLRLACDGARLITAFEVRPGERLWLDFDLPLGARFSGVEAVAGSAWRDGDGYTVADLGFPSPELRLGLGRALQDILSRLNNVG